MRLPSLQKIHQAIRSQPTAAPAGLPSDAKDALAKAFNSAINSENVSKVIQNVLKLKPNNLGPDDTKEMMVDGLANIAVLFGK